MNWVETGLRRAMGVEVYIVADDRYIVHTWQLERRDVGRGKGDGGWKSGV